MLGWGNSESGKESPVAPLKSFQEANWWLPNGHPVITKGPKTAPEYFLYVLKLTALQAPSSVSLISFTTPASNSGVESWGASQSSGELELVSMAGHKDWELDLDALEVR